jgi:hypothetical protein
VARTIFMLALAGTVVLGVFAVLSRPTTIDGFTLGVMVKCSPPLDPAAIGTSCASYPSRALAAFEELQPDHPAVVATEVFADGTQPGPIDFTGPGIPPTPAPRHPGPDVTIVVFTLEDGTKRAVGIACSKPDPTQRTVCKGVTSYPR